MPVSRPESRSPMNPEGLVVSPLWRLVEMLGEAGAAELLGRYRAVRESDTEAFLRERAVEMEKRDLSRTYLLMTCDLAAVLGYVTLGIKCLRVPDDSLVTGGMRRSMNIDSRTGVAQSYQLGQLSRSADAPKGTGALLLDLAFEHLASAQREVGCRTVRLDCRDELVPYYAGHGFRLISRNGSGSLNQMAAFIRGPKASARPERASGAARIRCDTGSRPAELRQPDHCFRWRRPAVAEACNHCATAKA